MVPLMLVIGTACPKVDKDYSGGNLFYILLVGRISYTNPDSAEVFPSKVLVLLNNHHEVCSI